jgi:hypothetical protein
MIGHQSRNLSAPRSIKTNMEKQRKRKGTGRLVPTRATGVEYRVNYGLQLVPELKQHGRGMRPVRWARCSVQSTYAHRIPQGEYFLHADEGGVFQVKLTGNAWRYLAAA